MEETSTYGRFKTWVGKAATSASPKPRELWTAVPVGKSWKKLGTPDATYEGMAEPRPLRIDLTSPSKSRRALDTNTVRCGGGSETRAGEVGVAPGRGVGDAQAQEIQSKMPKGSMAALLAIFVARCLFNEDEWRMTSRVMTRLDYVIPTKTVYSTQSKDR